MSKMKSLKMNFIMNAFLTMSSFIFPLITFPYVSRVLLPVGTGKVSFATSVVSYFSLFAQLGIPIYGIRACAKVRENREQLTRVVHELLMINLFMSLVSYTLLLSTVLFIPRLQEDRALTIIISLKIILSAIGMEWLYKALEQYAYITIRSLIFKCIAIILMFLLVHEEKDYIFYGGITIFAASASNIFNFINAHKYIDFMPVGNYNLKRHLKPIFIFFAMACATTIYTNLDTVMLGVISSDEEVGYYNAAVKIKNILVSVVASTGTVLLPRTSYYIEKGNLNEFQRICKKVMHFAVLIGIPLSLYFFIFAKESIFFLSGNAYYGSVLPMQIIMPTLIFIGMTDIFGTQMLVPLGKEKMVLVSEIFGAGIDLFLNAILIPVHGSAGAAMGTLVAEFIVLIVQMISLGKKSIEMYQEVSGLKILMAALLGAVCSYWVKDFGLGNFLTLILSAILFFGIYGFFLLFTKEALVIGLFHQLIDKFYQGKKAEH